MSSKEMATTHDGSSDSARRLVDTPDIPWYRQTELRKLYILMPFLFLGSTTLGYDGSVLNGLQTMNTWQEFFNHPVGSRLGIFGAMPGFGGLACLPFVPYIADGFGRRHGTAIGCLFILLGALLQSFPPASNAEPMYLAGRFFIGFGSNIANATCPLLITEVAHPRHRGKITTIYNTLWYLGAIIAAWCTYGTLVNLSGNLQWRLPTGLQCLMPGIQLLALYTVPESPRWLISKGKDDEALKILTKYHGNNVQDDFVTFEYNEIRETLRMEREAASRSGWADLVRTPGNRKRCILIILTAIFSQCSGNGLVSYYLSSILKTIGITKSTDQAVINGGLTIWCFLVSLGSAFLVDRVGRRVLFLFAGIGMLIAFTVWTACSAVYAKTGSQDAGSAVLAMIFLFYGAAGAAWPGLTVSYTVEILPYQIRAKGLTLCFTFTALSGVFNQYVNPIGLENLQWKFYFLYIAILVFQCLVIYFYYVETRGPTLEEIAVLFDGEDANVGGNDVHRDDKAVLSKSADHKEHV
ncbi:general substrate transporter [Rhexocercosporidium sp. MPI-PUGE-AT-0058]|nr:general substrate transporter [Rhexocercosporidium sp. MPI-PUGE-AT-0058]